ncbi:MAG: glycosyltransferase family 4 protein [Ktedonobacterales bacterium]
MISKALVAGTSQRKLEELVKCGAELTLVTPPYWRHDDGSTQVLERLYTTGYRIIETPLRFNGNYHLHYYTQLAKIMDDARPHVVHIDEEPYNTATVQAMYLAVRRHIPALFFAYQNIWRPYPPPFRQFEQYNYRHAAAAIAGNREAGEVLERKGYRGPLYIIAQFGFDTDIFRRSRPRPAREAGSPFTLVYLGRLKEEKGLLTLLEALPLLPQYCRAVFIGEGPMKSTLADYAASHGIGDRVELRPGIPTAQVPQVLSEMDALVLPSLSRPNWKEQFGRTLAEAMSCETPVIGSSSGEIPYVIGDAGLVFDEGNARALAGCVHRLISDPDLYAQLSRRGRQRVLDHFTQEQIARQTYLVYGKML